MESVDSQEKRKSCWTFFWCHPDIQIKCQVGTLSLDIYEKNNTQISDKKLGVVGNLVDLLNPCLKHFSAISANKTK